MTQNQQAIYDARTLGTGKMLTLGLQHMFAMFGATVLVPVITGLSMSATLLFAGLGTLIFHVLTKMKVPAFLGSSFAFLGGYATVVTMGEAQGLTITESLPYACIGVFSSGIIYFILAAFFAAYGARKVMRFFPPIVTGPIIIAIGLTLSGSAIGNCNQNWWIAILAIAIIIVCNIWGKRMIKIIPILLGVLGSYLVAACFGLCDFSAVKEAAWVGLPFRWENTAFHVFANPNWGKRHHRHRPHLPGHHDGTYRRYLRHFLHHRSELYGRSGPAPHPDGRRRGHHAGFPVRRPCQYHLR